MVELLNNNQQRRHFPSNNISHLRTLKEVKWKMKQ